MFVYLVIVAALAQFLGGCAYVRATLKGHTKPNRVTWALWGAAPILSTIILVLEGAASWAVVPVFMAGFIPMLVLFSSFFNKQAYWKLNTFDYVCGAMGAISLIFWLVADQPVVAVVMLVLTDSFAALPTIRKAWSNPETENAAVFVTGLIAASAGLMTLDNWRVLEYAFPVYLVLVNVMILSAMYGRTVFVKKSPTGEV